MAALSLDEGTWEVVIAGWGGKQGYHYPTWKIRWFVLESLVREESQDVLDAKEYFKNCNDSFKRAHNYHVKNDKKFLRLTYYTDDSLAELKERFVFNEETYWCCKQPRLSNPKVPGPKIDAIHLFCPGSNGSHKLIFIPFWGFMPIDKSLLCQPWVLSMEFGKPRAYDDEHSNYYHDYITVSEDDYGKTQKDMDAALTRFKAVFADSVVFQDKIRAAFVFAPILLGKHGQTDNMTQDKADMDSAREKQQEWFMIFNKKMKAMIAEKEKAGGREQWLKLCKQAAWRNLDFDEWMAIKDQDDNMESLPEELR